MTAPPAAHRTAPRLFGPVFIAVLACVMIAGLVAVRPAGAQTRAARTLTISVNRPSVVASGATVTMRCRAVDQDGEAIRGVRVTYRWRLPEGTRTQARTTAANGLAAVARVTDCGSSGDFRARVVVTATWRGQTRSVTRSFTIIGGT